MEILIFIVLAVIILFVWSKLDHKRKLKKQRSFIQRYSFPVSIFEKVQEKYPHLTQEDLKTVNKALREYFQVCNLAGKQMVSMPSQVVDVAWHEFILFTKRYGNFCENAFGHFLHHTPAEAMQGKHSAQKGIKLAWKYACESEGIKPRQADRLPLIFAIDAKLNIADGFSYALDCTKKSGDDYCGVHIGCHSCSSCSSCSSGSDSSGCGGGCGGGD